MCINDNCVICLSNYNNIYINTIILPCNHTFHKLCIFKSLQYQFKYTGLLSCPICRKSLNVYNCINHIFIYINHKIIKYKKIYKNIIKKHNNNLFIQKKIYNYLLFILNKYYNFKFIHGNNYNHIFINILDSYLLINLL